MMNPPDPSPVDLRSSGLGSTGLGSSGFVVYRTGPKSRVRSTIFAVHPLLFHYVGVGSGALADTHCDAPPPL